MLTLTREVDAAGCRWVDLPQGFAEHPLAEPLAMGWPSMLGLEAAGQALAVGGMRPAQARLDAGTSIHRSVGAPWAGSRPELAPVERLLRPRQRSARCGPRERPARSVR